MSVIRFAHVHVERKTSKVAALYVDKLGPYPRLVTEWYDERRDARNYLGSWPVVAHPPCGPWGSLKGLCTRQDRSLGPRAVAIVREFGGVLEHPAHSSLFAYEAMPTPESGMDRYGGRTYALNQLWFGHPCVKPTWIYVVDKNRPDHLLDASTIQQRINGLRRISKDATHRVCSGPRMGNLPSASRRMRTLTPLPFARFLISIAKGCGR